MGIAQGPLGRLFRRKTTKNLLDEPFAVQPSDNGPVKTDGQNPDRLLLLGNGALNGWGVTRREETIGGHLSVVLPARTGHAVHIELVNDPPAMCRDLPGLLSDTDLLAFDSIVVVSGVSDALDLRPVGEWSRAVTGLLDHLRREAPGLEIVWMGAQPPSTVPLLEIPSGGQVDRLTDELNASTQRLCRDRATFVRPPIVPVLGPRSRSVVDEAELARASDGYRAWAETLADCLVERRRASLTWGR